MFIVALLSGCHKDNDALDDSHISNMALSSVAGVRGDGGLWVSGDEIGVAMLSDGRLVGDGNVCYRADIGGSIADFTTQDPLYYPESGEASFVAYYPYCERSESVGDIDIDVEKLTNNLMVASEQSCLYGEPLSLDFEPLLSIVEFHVISADGYDSSMLDNISLSVDGLSTEASYSLVTGEFELGSVGRVSLSSSGRDNVYSIAIIPQISDSAVVELSLDSGATTHSYDLGVDNIESGLVYTYSATVSNSGVEFESLPIRPWGEDGTQSGVATTLPEGFTPIYNVEEYRDIFGDNEDFQGKYVTGKYILMTDIDLGNNWCEFSAEEGFVLDGNGHTITTKLSFGSAWYGDMDFCSGNEGIIQNVKFAGSRDYAQIENNGAGSFAAIAATNFGVIRNCESSITASGELSSVAGLVLYNHDGAYIYNCSVLGDLSTTYDSEYEYESSSLVMAGVVGRLHGGVVKNVYCAGRLMFPDREGRPLLGGHYVGSIIGLVDLEDSAATVDVDYLFSSDVNDELLFVGEVDDESLIRFSESISTANLVAVPSDKMKSEEFALMLNNGAVEISKDPLIDDVAAWKFNGDYPEIDIYADPIGSDLDYTADGSEANPYLLTSAEDFKVLSDEVAAGDDKSGVYYVVSRSITLATLLTKWLPIGTKETHFQGHIKGVGGQVRKVYLATSSASDQLTGLFGYVGESATIEGIMMDGNVVANYHVGALAVYNYGTISNCMNYATIFTQGAYSVVGGLVAENMSSGTVKDCYNAGLLSEEGSYVTIGSVIGINQGATSGLTSSYNPTINGYETICEEGSGYLIGEDR